MNEAMFGVGVACIIAAIVGGGMTVLGQQFPVIGSLGRQAALCCFGIVLSLFAHGNMQSEAGGLAFNVRDELGSECGQISEQVKLTVDGTYRGTLSVDYLTHERTKLPITVPSPGRYSYSTETVAMFEDGGSVFEARGVYNGMIDVEPNTDIRTVVDTPWCPEPGDQWLVELWVDDE
jgi:hypothetical protein